MVRTLLFFLFYLQCFVLILNGDSDTLGILVRRRCTRARSGDELFPKKEEVTGDRFPSRKRVLLKSQVGESVERGDCSGGRGRFGDIFFLLFLPISPSLSIAVQESKEECKGQLGLNTLFFFSLSLSIPVLSELKSSIYIYIQSRDSFCFTATPGERLRTTGSDRSQTHHGRV